MRTLNIKHKTSAYKLGIIGCGNMGEAILKSIVGKRVFSPRQIAASDARRSRLRAMRRYGVRLATNKELAKFSRAILLAVKPQDAAGVLLDLRKDISAGTLLISICAGISVERLNRLIGGRCAVIRVMPNLPVIIGEGVSAMSYGKGVSAAQKVLAHRVFSAAGEIVECREKILDAVTAVSGSGPAYAAYLAEILIKTAARWGIARIQARRLAVQTILGTALLMRDGALDPAALRSRVSSRGGTTEAAFKVFKRRKLEKILMEGFLAAKQRARELAV